MLCGDLHINMRQNKATQQLEHGCPGVTRRRYPMKRIFAPCGAVLSDVRTKKEQLYSPLESL